MEEENPTLHVALIVGVTGMVGVALAEALKKPTALGGPWKIYGVARRALPVWFPPSFLDEFIMLDTLNEENTSKMLSPISSVITHLFWVAISVNQSEEINISRNSSMLSNVLYALTSSPNSQLRHVTLQTGTKQYMGPILDIAFSNHLVPHDAPFREDYPRLPFPNFYYALEDILASYPKPITYSIHRSSLIIGASSRSYFNMLLSLSVYALICKHGNYPFRYAGNKYSWEHFWDMSDARVLAEQQIWASVTDKAKNQAFNCTNGDVFTWKMLWKVLCDVFDVEFVPFDEQEEFDFADFLKDKGEVWDEIVKTNGLYNTKIEEITCFNEIQFILKNLNIQHVCSMYKSREFGFHGYADTLASIAPWVERLRQMKILP
ncbi:3-oxo-delta(4,5)-steroid 5-beta-reductase-like protein [Tanacetum coccineum]|uniref:3-oxo-delta(4,5)-steroid 5-beta-reductase-like protein n=1 Tax=Tanacetum coccineum TaxID=301880 RepID=A0ABQ4WSD1_9ASTR